MTNVNIDYENTINEIVNRYLQTDDFWSTEIVIPVEERSKWICMRKNPKHFTTAMFIGDWSDASKLPGDGVVRLLRIMEMPDDSLRIIGRQDKDLYVLMLK